MKKLFCFVICLIMVLANIVYADAENAHISYIEKEIEIPGTTPAKDAVLDMLGTDEMIDISMQIYNNLLKQDPYMFLLTDTGICNINGWDEMKEGELSWVKAKALEVTDGLETAEDKIFAVAEYVALTVCYDNDYYYGKKKYEDLNHHAYDVLTQETAVCYGYAATSSALLQCVGIPCVLMESPAHVWNMAYTGERWILFDSTWMSNNEYEDGNKDKKDYVNMRWYDYTIDYANSNYNHIVECATYSEHDNGIYSFPIYSKIKSYEIPQYITTIGEFAFDLCSNIILTYNGVFKNVERAAFQGCSLLQGVINLDDIENLGSHAFFECSSITDVILGDGISVIPTAAFYSCKNLKNIVMHPSVYCIDGYAFTFCSNLSVIYYYGTSSDWINTVIDNTNSALRGLTIIYNYVPNIKITKQGTSLYNTKFIGIPTREIVVLAEYADGELSNVTYKTLKTTLNFNVSSNSDVRFFVFDGLNSLRPLTESTASAGTLYFNNESNGELVIENAEIAECLGEGGFVDYDKVTVKVKINAANTVDDIVILLSASSDADISDSIYLNQIDMPQNGIVEVTLSKERIATALGVDKLDNCSLYLKVGGTGIKKSASETLYYEANVNEEENGFRYNRLTGEIEIITNGDMLDYPAVNTVPWHSHAASITEIAIDKNVTRIGNYSFADCTSVTSVKIPRNVQSIGKYAFSGAKNLAEVKIVSKTTVIEEGAFDECADNLVILCVEGSNAEQYALQHGIEVSYISDCLPGDADGNDAINIRDAAVILQFIAGWDVTIIDAAADADGNGVVNIRDAAIILQFIAGWDVVLG